MEIVFVILHFMAEEETIKCVDNIKKQIDTSKYHIVIVDNGSGDRSGERLQERYKTDGNVTMILSKTNMGFAKGNNLGFKYAKKVWDPRYIVLMNNDVFLLSHDLISVLDDEYEKSKFAVLGPMILTRDGRCNVNPQKPEFETIVEIKKYIRQYKYDLWRYKYHLEKVYGLLKVLKKVFSSKKKHYNNFLQRCENVKLHGCFWVFSQQYIKKYNGLDESTFLYWEEEFLYKHMISNNMKTVYNPNIIVYHHEDVSTDKMLKGTREKYMFVRENYIRSLQQLVKVFEFYQKRKNDDE